MQVKNNNEDTANFPQHCPIPIPLPKERITRNQICIVLRLMLSKFTIKYLETDIQFASARFYIRRPKLENRHLFLTICRLPVIKLSYRIYAVT